MKIKKWDHPAHRSRIKKVIKNEHIVLDYSIVPRVGKKSTPKNLIVDSKLFGGKFIILN